jgi:hypothetical protein
VIDRRTFLAGTGTVLLAAPFAAEAQPAGKLPRIGVLWHAANAEEEGPYLRALLEGFRSVGYVEGRNIAFEHRFPNEIPNAQTSRLYIDITRNAATELALVVQTFQARSVDELESAFDAMVRAKMQAVTVNPDGLAFQGRAIIARLALERHLPLATYSRDTFEVGALLSYGADHRAICRRGAVYVDKILKGAKPSDLPVEGPTRFEFIINLNTAKALGLTIPPSLLGRADEVIQ